MPLDPNMFSLHRIPYKFTKHTQNPHPAKITPLPVLLICALRRFHLCQPVWLVRELARMPLCPALSSFLNKQLLTKTKHAELHLL